MSKKRSERDKISYNPDSKTSFAGLRRDIIVSKEGAIKTLVFNSRACLLRAALLDAYARRIGPMFSKLRARQIKAAPSIIISQLHPN